MAQLIPPSPVGSPFTSYTWADWYEKVRRAINDSQHISWSQITDFTGSNLTSIATRNHNDLQNIQTSPAGTGRGHVPVGGTTAYVLTKSSNADYDYAWVASSGGITALTGDVTASGTGSVAATIALGVQHRWTKPQNVAPSTLTDSANIAPVGTNSNNFYLLLTSAIGATRNIAVPTGLSAGDIVNFEIVQPSSGGPCAIVFASGYKWGLGGQSTQPAASTVASASEFYSFVVQNNGNLHGTMIGQAGPTGTAGTNGTNGSGSPIGICGRLTLETGVPVSTTDQTAKSTIYFTPFRGNNLVLWDGAAWTGYTFTEVSVALGTLASATIPNDVFVRQVAGTATLDILAWSTATARATAVTLQDGRYCKSGDKTRLYLGTFYPTSTTTTEDSGGTASQTGGKRFLWNYYNRVQRKIRYFDNTTTWNYTTAAWRQANNIAAAKVECVIGMQEDAIKVQLLANVSILSNSTSGGSGIGVSSITTPSGQSSYGYINPATTLQIGLKSFYDELPTLGYQYFSWLEEGMTAGTTTWIGNNGSGLASGLTATVWA